MTEFDLYYDTTRKTLRFGSSWWVVEQAVLNFEMCNDIVSVSSGGGSWDDMTFMLVTYTSKSLRSKPVSFQNWYATRRVVEASTILRLCAYLDRTVKVMPT